MNKTEILERINKILETDDWSNMELNMLLKLKYDLREDLGFKTIIRGSGGTVCV